MIEQSDALATSNAELDALRKALDAHAIVSITDEFGSITHANDKFCEITGFRADDQRQYHAWVDQQEDRS